jgi:hypothetical protein
MMVPGELTSAWTAGRRRRYFGPVALAVSSLVLFAMITALGGLRPRPDRTLMIGAERTAENPGGLADRTPLNLAVDAPPDLVHDVANAIEFVPVLWLPLMACGVVAIVALARTKRQHDDYMELVFATDFAAWYVLWWGVAVPLILLLSKFGFEYSAAFDGLNHVRYVADGRIDGLSATWNTLRNLTVSPLFHSVLVAAGIGPWAVLAFRRAFDSSWLRAGCAGLLIATVPLLLLIPFA